MVDISGERFGRLVVTSRNGSSKDGRVTWNCLCDCGNIFVATGKSIRKGHTRSCGCLHKETSIKNLPKNDRPIGYERITSKGYVEIRTERGFIRKHVYVMESHIGRRLMPGEIVHHKDEDILNNDISNLQLMTHGEHTAMHNTGRKLSYEARKNIAKKNSILTIDEANLIRKRVLNGESQISVARELGISPNVVSNITRNNTYKEEMWQA